MMEAVFYKIVKIYMWDDPRQQNIKSLSQKMTKYYSHSSSIRKMKVLQQGELEFAGVVKNLGMYIDLMI